MKVSIAANIDRAVAFVQARGSDAERSRLQYTLSGVPASSEVVAALLAGQREDGGWAPFWAPEYSSLDATCFRLAQAEQLDVRGVEPAVAQAVRFLAGRQRPDGSWEEDESVVELAPPWAEPGREEARLYLTANCGFWLALLNPQGDNAPRAAQHIERHLRGDGSLPTFLHGHWLAGGLFYLLGRHEQAEGLFTYLAETMGDRVAGGSLAWLITTLHLSGVPSGHPLLRKASTMLAEKQRADGSWESEDGPGRDPHATVEAVRALSLLSGVA